MNTDAIREALSATREAWQDANDQSPSADPDEAAAVLLELDNAIVALEQALRLAGAEPSD